MTAGKLVIFTIIAIVLTTLVKVFFITTLNMGNAYVVYFMWFLIAAITVGCCRRLGVINYLEAILTLIVWLAVALVVDLVVTATIAGIGIYQHVYLWIGYAVMVLCVFLFHKKRHVEVRRLQAAKEAPKKAHH